MIFGPKKQNDNLSERVKKPHEARCQKVKSFRDLVYGVYCVCVCLHLDEIRARRTIVFKGQKGGVVLYPASGVDLGVDLDFDLGKGGEW